MAGTIANAERTLAGSAAIQQYSLISIYASLGCVLSCLHAAEGLSSLCVNRNATTARSRLMFMP